MEFTGERYIPSLQGHIKYEHIHRYALCMQLVIDKSVLDLASGEGYGAAILSKVAQSVVGVDIDTASIEYAKREYSDYENLRFLTGSCESIPLPEKSIDVVTSFETIEHHDQHQEMLQEIKRVLKPDGLLVISSPNRLIYSDQSGYSNPFHVKELYYEEFIHLLSQNFKHIQVYGQRLAAGSFILPLENSEETNINNYSGNITDVKQIVRPLESPLYFIAICSDRSEVINSVISSVYIDTNDDLLKVFESNYHQTQEALQNSQMQLHQTQEALQNSQMQLHQTQEVVRNYESTIKDMEKSKFWKLRKAFFFVKQLIFSNENKSKNQP
jgi:ubiquinone/menaquinone biosynthesis C-methylase UbiE